MTRDEILQLPAGRGSDALVAERIMGIPALSRSMHDGCVLWHERAGRRIYTVGVPEYTTAIADAWQVFRSRFLTAQIIGYVPQSPVERKDLTDQVSGGYVVEWNCTANGKNVFAPTAPLAICRAALLTALEMGIAI